MPAIQIVMVVTNRAYPLTVSPDISIYENMNDCSYIDKSLSLDTLFELSEFFKSAVSHQLRILRTAGLVKPRRAGRTIFYSLDDEHIGMIFKTGLAHILHKKGA